MERGRQGLAQRHDSRELTRRYKFHFCSHFPASPYWSLGIDKTKLQNKAGKCTFLLVISGTELLPRY